MIKPKQNRQQNRKGQRQENLSHRNPLPEMHKPPPRLDRRHERPPRRQRLHLDICHLPHVHEPRKENYCEGRPVVLDKHSDGVVKQRGLGPDLAADVGYGEY